MIMKAFEKLHKKEWTQDDFMSYMMLQDAERDATFYIDTIKDKAAKEKDEAAKEAERKIVETAEKVRAETTEKVRAEATEKVRKAAAKFLKMGLSVQDVAQGSGLSLSEVRKISATIIE